MVEYLKKNKLSKAIVHIALTSMLICSAHAIELIAEGKGWEVSNSGPVDI